MKTVGGLMVLMMMWLMGSASSQAGEPFKLQLRWYDQAQFMGYYVALDKGFYEEEGLDVTIVPGGPNTNAIEVLRNGEADMIVEWVALALTTPNAGNNPVNIAQLYQNSGLMLACMRSRSIYRADDLRGKTIGSRGGSLEIPLRTWLASIGIPVTGGADGVEIVYQNGDDGILEGDPDCVMGMIYNEYWQLIEQGLSPRQLAIFRFEELGFSLLEDGLYISDTCIANDVCRGRSTRFLRASLRGWQYSIDNPERAIEEVLGLLAEQGPLSAATRRHQTHMAREVFKLLGQNIDDLGLLDIGSYQRTVRLLRQNRVDSSVIRRDHRKAWNHELWSDAVGETRTLVDRNTLYHFKREMNKDWLYWLILFGSAIYGIAGFLRAQEQKYDVWGALVLTALPTVGGGTIRDLLVGGDRLPLFVVTDPNYAYAIGGIIIVGGILAYVLPQSEKLMGRLVGLQIYCETIGLAVLTVAGAQVAIVAELPWFWVPICAALTCSGGGIMLDVATGREPAAFQGRPFEELSIVAGLLMVGLLHLGNYMFHPEDYMIWIPVIVLAFVVGSRIVLIKTGLQSPRLGVRSQS
jgi:NitT/TauT family transport system substrate-binding protein